MIEIADQAKELLKDWKYLPYRKVVLEPSHAVDLLLSSYTVSQNKQFQPDGKLHFYSDKARLAGLRFLASETEMLKLSCGRLEPFVVNSGHALQESEVCDSVRFLNHVLNSAAELEHISAPVAPSDTVAQLALSAVGFRMADTILGYHLDLDLVKESGDSDNNVRVANERDAERVAEIAAKCFSDRSLNVNRFNSEPRFSASDVGNMYASWAKAAILHKQADLTLVYDSDESVSGFMTFKKPSVSEKSAGVNLGKAVLSAVDPVCQKRGIYRKLLHAGCLWLKNAGADSIEGKTQLSTLPVLHVWQSIGAALKVAYHTFHYSKR